MGSNHRRARLQRAALPLSYLCELEHFQESLPPAWPAVETGFPSENATMQKSGAAGENRTPRRLVGNELLCH
jgi:hypothetical protein